MNITINGTTIISNVNQTPLNGSKTRMNISGVYNFAANEYAEIVVSQTSGGDLTVDYENMATPHATMTYLCP
jgi:hypothetical protein